MDLWHDVSVGADAPDTVNVIVEIPKGSQNKYEYSKEHGLFQLDRVLFSPMHYPGDYGFIPQTLGEDNDPLDGLVLVTFPTAPGILIESRPIGMLQMIDGGEGDDKVLAVPVNDPRWSDVQDIDDIPEIVQREIGHFFAVYKQLEGKTVEVKDWQPKAAAREVIEAAVARYQEQKKS